MKHNDLLRDDGVFNEDAIERRTRHFIATVRTATTPERPIITVWLASIAFLHPQKFAHISLHS
jgi:hypothetical protein